jgi:hypothetical protein
MDVCKGVERAKEKIPWQRMHTIMKTKEGVKKKHKDGTPNKKIKAQK